MAASTGERKGTLVGNGFMKGDEVFRDVRLPDGSNGRYRILNEKVFEKAVDKANRKADELEQKRKRTPETA